MLTSDNILANVIQETQADLTLIRNGGENSLGTPSYSKPRANQGIRGADKDGNITPIDKVVGNFMACKINAQAKTFLLLLCSHEITQVLSVICRVKYLYLSIIFSLLVNTCTRSFKNV